ncbi:MAG: hypothetical protein NZ959_09730, partial [Armatimonadetes bacterium]|nr:hypothetical protein [Armatimonadota bacterium]
MSHIGPAKGQGVCLSVPFCFAVCVLLFGCGGGKKMTTLVPGPSDVTDNIGPPSLESATARFFVNVQTGEVTVTPLSGSSSDRAVFTGTAVSFTSSTLLDQPGNTGIKVLRVSLTNRMGIPMGQLPNGTVTGVRVLLSPITNVGAFSDLRPLVQVNTVGGTGAPSSVDGPAPSASFNLPIGVAVDSAGNVYVSEFTGRRIRKIS